MNATATETPDIAISEPPAIFNPPLPGQPWPEQGGTYVGIMRGDAGRLYHLIVATDPAGDFEDLEWGGYGQRIDGAGSKWDGQANTLVLINADSDHPAAQAAAAVDIGGHHDWYMPAQRELSLCWAVVPDLFATDDWYWSSTQRSANLAWFQNFSSGYQNRADKGGTGRARAVRRLVIQ